MNLSRRTLADLAAQDEEGAQHYRDEFATLNHLLAAESIPRHEEPESCGTYSCAMWGYSGLHYLRRLAAHLELSGELPPPGDDDASDDPVLAKYFEIYGGGDTPAAQALRFNHLIIHSDAEGYYLPTDFPSIVFADEEHPIAGGMAGSALRLREECRALAQALALPLDLDPEDSDVADAAEDQGEGGEGWRKYGVESHTCLALYRAAEHSIKTGAAIVFT